MPYISELIEGYRRFRDHDWARERERWSELAEGQSPQVMILSCADSRVEPAQIFDARPGEMFVVRNIAGLAPPYETSSGFHGVSAALEFAVTQLEVEELVVERVRQIIGGRVTDMVHNHHNYAWRETHGGEEMIAVLPGAGAVRFNDARPCPRGTLLIGTDPATQALVFSELPATIERFVRDCTALAPSAYLALASSRSSGDSG